MRVRSTRSRLLFIGFSVVVALAGAGIVLALRTATGGAEPQGRNWWIVADTVLGLAYLPLGVALTLRGRARLGVVYVLIGGFALATAIQSEWHAYKSSESGTPVVQHWSLFQTVFAVLLALVVPWLLPWPRRRSGDPLTRWFALGVAAAWLAAAAAVIKPIGDVPGAHVAAPLLLLGTVAPLAVGAFVADIRDDRTALGAVAHRFFVWLTLATGVVLVYTTLVAGFGLVLGANGPAWLLVGVTGGLAIAAEPVRSLLWRHVNDLVYGKRGDPLAVVRKLVNQQIAGGSEVNETLLASLAATIAEALRLDHVAVDLRWGLEWTRVAEYGAPGGQDERFPLTTGDQIVGRLVVGCRSAALGKRDREVLADVVPHVTLALALVRVTGELRRSRLSVVAAREEERRRLRRDLHDGVGPSLTGISMGLRTVVRRLRRSGGDASDVALLDRLADGVDASTGEVKRIIRDLRPNALDDHGLAGALTEFAATLADVLDVTLELPSSSECFLPAAVETAVYRIAMEALNNVVRHAAATRCSVHLAVGEEVQLDITDDGVGLPDQPLAGVGLTTMRERAAELGGRTAIAAVIPHGTRVHATLPLSVTP